MCVHVIPSPTVLGLLRRNFMWSALQGACGAGIFRCSSPLPNCAHQKVWPNFSIFPINPVKFSPSLLEVSKGAPLESQAHKQWDRGSLCTLAKLLFPTVVWACVLKPWTTRKVPLLWAREDTTETDCWSGIARQGEESSAPLSWSTEKPPSLGGSRAADGHPAALSSQGVYHFSDYLDADTRVGEEPLLWLAPVFFMPPPLFFFCSCY